ncbi:nitrous oxide reductase accessory protein NosL [Flavobacterium sp. H122]|uniref:nitrous oxide reductase accessory protein NosL n=1 Tax=Flavobacterium sp. H122 TaxID=2529860 RepID=UPI0010AAFA18|nr:nitrous oxide reductase accessory protein NosL [Flavobacterium sp. H122]
MKKVLLVLVSVFLWSCHPSGPKSLKLNTDSCDFCKMSISSGKHGAEVVTQKGRVYKFDDIGCMMQYVKENNETEFKEFYVGDFSKTNELIRAEQSVFLQGGTIQSPMNSKIIAFSTMEEAKKHNNSLKARVVSWNDIKNSY